MVKKSEITQEDIEAFIEVLKKIKESNDDNNLLVEDHRFEETKNLSESNLVKVVEKELSNLINEDLIDNELDIRREKDDEKDYSKDNIYKQNLNGTYETKKNKKYGDEINKGDYEAISYDQRNTTDDDTRM